MMKIFLFPVFFSFFFLQASSEDITASLHRNVLSWGVWQGPEEKENVSLSPVTQTAYTQLWLQDSGLSNLLRTASDPDVLGRSPKTAFTSSITITAWNVWPSPVESVCPKRRMKVSTCHLLPERRISTSTMRVSNSHLDLCKQNPTIVTPNQLRQAADGRAAGDPGKKKVQDAQCRPSYTEGERKRDVIGGSLMNSSYQSCIHHEVPLRSTSSVVFLDKSLSISLMELEGGTVGQPALYRSTLSVRLGAANCCTSPIDNKPAKTNEGYGRHRPTVLGRNKRNGRDSGLGHCRSSLSKQRGREVEQIAPAHGINNKTHDLDTQHHGPTLGLLSFRGPSPSNTKAGRQKGNADEAAFPSESNFRHRQNTFNIGPGMNFITFLQKWKSKVPTPIDVYIPFSDSYILKLLKIRSRLQAVTASWMWCYGGLRGWKVSPFFFPHSASHLLIYASCITKRHPPSHPPHFSYCTFSMFRLNPNWYMHTLISAADLNKEQTLSFILPWLPTI